MTNECTSSQLRAWAPAKVNLFLEVLARREDGYHEIETLMVAVNLYDTLDFVADAEGSLRLTCQWAVGFRPRDASARQSIDSIPAGEENLVVQAVQLLRQEAGCRHGARMHLCKRIPAAAGLGGASSDAAAALLTANRAWRLNWPLERLTPIAAQLGSDVPFFLQPVPAVCRGRGERIEPVELAGPLHLVIVRPPTGLATGEVYRQCRPADRAESVRSMVSALRHGGPAAIGDRLLNRLQPAAEELNEWIERLRHELDRFDLYGHQMSGSGSSYFGICQHARHARRVAERLRLRRLGRVICARTDRFSRCHDASSRPR